MLFRSRKWSLQGLVRSSYVFIHTFTIAAKRTGKPEVPSRFVFEMNEITRVGADIILNCCRGISCNK